MKQILIILILISNITANQILIDDDKDMIPNKYDKCPNTPNGVCVDANGCTQVIKRVIHFDSASHKINVNNRANIKSIIEIAKECFGYQILIKGHTDSTYTSKFNLKLSKHRAKVIQNMFLSKKIDKNRLTTKWYGETKPIATNVTKNGRYQNRRVEIIFK